MLSKIETGITEFEKPFIPKAVWDDLMSRPTKFWLAILATPLTPLLYNKILPKYALIYANSLTLNVWVYIVFTYFY